MAGLKGGELTTSAPSCSLPHFTYLHSQSHSSRRAWLPLGLGREVSYHEDRKSPQATGVSGPANPLSLVGAQPALLTMSHQPKGQGEEGESVLISTPPLPLNTPPPPHGSLGSSRGQESRKDLSRHRDLGLRSGPAVVGLLSSLSLVIQPLPASSGRRRQPPLLAGLLEGFKTTGAECHAQHLS